MTTCVAKGMCALEPLDVVATLRRPDNVDPPKIWAARAELVEKAKGERYVSLDQIVSRSRVPGGEGGQRAVWGGMGRRGIGGGRTEAHTALAPTGCGLP